MNRIALIICLSLAAATVHAAELSCMPHAPNGHAPQWAVEVEKQRGGAPAMSPRDPIWQHATCDESRRTVKWRFPSAGQDNDVCANPHGSCTFATDATRAAPAAAAVGELTCETIMYDWGVAKKIGSYCPGEKDFHAIHAASLRCMSYGLDTSLQIKEVDGELWALNKMEETGLDYFCSRFK